jgi:hypothetical protein
LPLLEEALEDPALRAEERAAIVAAFADAGAIERAAALLLELHRAPTASSTRRAFALAAIPAATYAAIAAKLEADARIALKAGEPARAVELLEAAEPRTGAAPPERRFLWPSVR